jgi:hypothetical protein
MEALLTPLLEIRSLGNSLTLADSNTDEKRLPPFGSRLGNSIWADVFHGW